MQLQSTQRLESLDILRGFDLFCLVALEGIMHRFAHAIDKPWMDSFIWNFSHVEWTGFSPWDLVMPLFMFMSGITIPFAMAKYKNGEADKSQAYKRIAKRVVLLWIFGMMCQGNLLALDPDRIFLYSNTLQAIATGYLVASLLYLWSDVKVQVGIAVALLLAFWGCMEFISVDGYGGGNYLPDNNLAEWIDRAVLGRFRDGATTENGAVVFSEGYRYTWILSSLTFAVTSLTGLFAGTILKSASTTQKRKIILLAVIGIGMVAAGWLWNLQMPVIKKIWTSSMVLVSSGYCFLLMALFYYIVDYRHLTKYIGWLKIYGTNSIAAYMMANIINFYAIGESLFYGLAQYMGEYYSILIALTRVVIMFLILRYMYRQKIFLRV